MPLVCSERARRRHMGYPLPPHQGPSSTTRVPLRPVPVNSAIPWPRRQDWSDEAPLGLSDVEWAEELGAKWEGDELVTYGYPSLTGLLG